MIEIRPLSKNDDFDDLISLSREFFQEYEAHHKDFFKIAKLEDGDILSYFSSFLDHETREAIIAVDGERIVGYITVYVKDQANYWQIRRVGEISGLMVRKEYRHGGMAKRLLAEAREFFERKAVKYYTAYTSVENRIALEFYKQNGLVPLYTTMIGEIGAPDSG